MQVDGHHLARPQPPFGFEHVLSVENPAGSAGSVDPNVMDCQWQVLMQIFGFEVTVVNQNPKSMAIIIEG